VWGLVGFWALFKHEGWRRDEDVPSCMGCMLCPPRQKGNGDEELTCLGSAEALPVSHRERLKEERLAGFSSGSATGRVPSGWRSWGGRGCPIALACSDLSLVPQFPPPPVGRLKKRAGNVRRQPRSLQACALCPAGRQG